VPQTSTHADQPDPVAKQEYSHVLAFIETECNNDLFLTAIAYLKYKKAKRGFITSKKLNCDDPLVRDYYKNFSDELLRQLIQSAEKDVSDHVEKVKATLDEEEVQLTRDGTFTQEIRAVVQEVQTEVKAQSREIQAEMARLDGSIRRDRDLQLGPWATVIIAVCLTILTVIAIFREVRGSNTQTPPAATSSSPAPARNP
jgi:predicted AAA+ superfamily ATPase